MIKSQRNSELSRRAILQRIGWGVAAAALSPAARMYGDSVSPVMMKLSDYMSAARESRIAGGRDRKDEGTYPGHIRRDGVGFRSCLPDKRR